MQNRLVLVVSLWLNGSDVAAFEAFEREAAPTIARHGGRTERVIRLQTAPGQAEDTPFEIHVVTFPDELAFASYRADPEVQARASRRELVIARTLILSGFDVEPY